VRCRFLVAALALASTAQAADLKIPNQKYKLKNGLTVILAEDHRLPLASVNLWYHASPANEPDRRSGFAHLFEHMMFKGSKHVADGGHIRTIEENGVSLYNATTDYDRTNYFETMPSNKLELALWLESDRMGFLVDTLTREKLDNQRDVVRNERRQSVENVPYGASEEAMVQGLYPKDHPYHGYVIGSHEDLDAATVSDVVNFHKAFYSPANATLVVAGDFAVDATKKMIEKYFGALPGGKRQVDRAVPVPQPSATRVVKEDAVTLPRVWFGWVTPAAFGEGDAEIDLASLVFGGNRSSRLYKHLVHDQQVASDVKCLRQPLALGSPLYCWATAAEGKSAAEVEKAFQKEIDDLRNKPVAVDEIDRARNTLFAKTLSSLEQLGGFNGKSDQLQFYDHYQNEPDGLAKDFARYRAVTPQSLQAAVGKLTDAHRITVVTVPKKEGAK
jgi:zinc protease